MATDFKKRIEEKYRQELSNMTFEERINEKYQQELRLERQTTPNKKKKEEEDIAPVKKERNYWFEKGAFSDGYDFGDVTKSILGTAADIGLGAAKGVGGLLEGVNDFAWRRTEDVAEALGADNFAKKAKGYADKDSIDSILKPAEDFVKPYTLAGGLVQQTSQALGQVGGIIATGGLGAAAGLGSLGATALTTGTMFLSSAGSNESQAYKEGATEKEAKLYGTIAGTADAITELMFGGLGKSLNIVGLNKGMFSADDLLAKKVSEKVSSQIAKNFAEFGIKASGEGLEEVAAGLIQAVGKKITYMEEEELGKIIEDEDLLNQFVVGAITSGIVQSRGLVKSNKAGRDYITGLTGDEQKVIDAEVGARTDDIRKNKAVQEAVDKAITDVEKTKGKLTDEGRKAHRELVLKELEASGVDFSSIKLDRKEISAIEKQVKEDFDKGYISVDTIESTLFPENAKRHKELLEESKTADEARRAEINEELKTLGNTLNETLNKNEFLKESYRQRELKNQPFQVEVSETDGEMKKHLVEEFTKAGVGNDRRAHETFDFLNKLSTESNTKINVVSSEWLKKNNYNPTTEGFLKREGGAREIVINKDSPAFINSVMGHEVTHMFEGSEEYPKLQKILKEYATSKGEYDQMLRITQETYKDVANAVPENEVTSQLVGKYIFTDYEFANNLSVKEPNIFKKVYDYIKHVYKMATAGSKEARQLEQAKRIWEKAYREMSKSATQEGKTNSVTDADSSTKFLIAKDGKGNDVVVINQNIYDGMLDDDKPHEYIADFIAAEIGNSYKIIEDGEVVYIGEDLPGEFTQSKYTQMLLAKRQGLLKAKNQTAQNLKDIIEIATDPKYEKNTEPKHNIDAKYGFYKYTTRFAIDKGKGSGPEYKAVLVVRHDADGKKYLYDITKIKKVGTLQLTSTSQGSHGYAGGQTPPQGNPTTNSIPLKDDGSNTQFSLSTPVEETKNLMAIHNLHANELLKQLDMGGLPMPSVAVTKPEIISHDNFGEVTLILNKDAIDPKKSKYNKVYSADAYTPTFPSVSYKVNEEAADRVTGKVNALYNKLPDFYQRSVRSLRDSDNIEDILNREGGESKLIERYSDDYGMKQLYLAEKGETVPVAIKETRVEMTDYQKENAQAVIDGLGEDIVMAIVPKTPGPHNIELRKQWYAEHGEKLKEIYVDLFIKDGFSREDSVEIVNSEKALYWVNRAKEAAEYLKTGGVTTKEESDYHATETEIDNRIDDKDFRQWLKELFSGIEGKSGIRNNKDMFMPSGKRRSFDALHDPVTLDNIVKAMRGKAQQKGEGFLGGNLEGAAAREYKSIQDVKKDSGRLGVLSEEEHEANKQYISETLEGIAERYAAGKSLWDARNTLVEAVASSETRRGIEKYLKEYDYVYKTDDSIVDDLIELRDYIRSLPTPYFEAKPQRAVGLDEVGVYVIPNNADAELKRKLLEAGYSIAEYNPDIEGDRQKVVNQFEQYKFSLSNGAAPTGGTRWSDILMENDSLPTAEETVPETPVEEIAPVVIPEELRYEEGQPLTEEDLPYFEQERSWSFENITEEDLPAEVEEESYSIPNTAPLDDKSLRLLAKNMKDELNLKPKQIKNLEQIIQDFSTSEDATRETLYEMIEEEFGTIYSDNKIDEVVQVKKDLRDLRIKVSDTIKGDIPDYFQWKQKNFGKIRFSNQGLPVDDVYEGLKTLYPGYFPADIDNPTDQLLKMAEVANLDSVYTEEYFLPEEQIQDVTDFIYESVQDYKQEMAMKASHEANLAPIDESMIPYEPKVKRELPPSNFDSHDFTESRGVQQEYDMEAGEIVDDTHDIELERLEKRKQKALDNLGDLTSYTKQQAKELYDEVRMMQKGKKVSGDLGFILDRMFEGVDKKAPNYEEVKDATYKKITDALLAIERKPAKPEREVPPTEALIRNSIETKYGWRVSEIEGMKLDSRAEARRKLRKELLGVNAEGLTKALDDAKNVSMMLMNNTDTIRNTELVFGRENGKIINEAIFQKEIDNEAKSIAWQNKERAEIKELGIKARSKESAAVQKYGEKQYVNEFGDLVKYGDDELAAEFSDVETQAKIRKAARIIREKYDTYIDLANETLTKLGFDPIKKRSDYMRHFQELNDVFSRYGIPFNAEAMQEHDLPTDINGLTDSWSPQKNYFANMQPRKGQRTTLDAVTGIDGYIGGIANLIYHTEDIQRGRAFEEIIRETYGQEKGWENLEALEGLSPEEYQARADKIQDNHLSNYAAWVHEWTNNVAGKKSKVDRSIESMFGRKAFALLDQVRKQVGSNMIGMNLSSSLTNLVAPVQAASKTKKLAVVKGTADTIKNIFVKDDFMEKNSFLTARMGTDMLSKNAWQKIQDAGYIFMKGMDWFSSNQIVRSKYYELLSKGMTEEQAHAEAGKFAARIMGDRTKGAQPQLYNSKLIGLVTQFQLEVNNQLYSMFYDTYHESKEAAKNNAAKTAAGMTFTLGQLAAMTHVFGQTFEAVAGYNPTFDIIGIIATALGAGDDDDEKTTSERLTKAFDMLVDALPYVNVMTGGGRIPIASGIPNPIAVMTGAKDNYGNERTWGDELEKLRYLVLPTGGNQIKKTMQGLGMFDEDLPVTGSYTDSGNLRFPVEDTPLNRIQAGLFGQWASGNAGDYFDQKRQPLKEKQIQEYADLDIPIADYWEYRDGLKGLKTVEEKFDYVAGLDLPVSKKNIMINNIVDRDEKVDLINYDDFGSYEEFDWATKNPEKYDYLQSIGASYKDYAASEKSKEAYNWAYKNPEGYVVSKAVTGDVVEYRKIASELYDIKADKDGNGKTISGSRKEKVAAYINNMDADYGSKIVLFKSEYPSDDTYNYEIIDYLNNRQDISYGEMQTILTELGFTVDAEGNIYW